jgi:quercetin 2,3-dioxygenase
MTCNGTALRKRDSTGIWSTDKVTIQTGAEKSDILIVETVM